MDIFLFDRNTLLFSFPVSFPPHQKGDTPTIPQVRKTPNFKCKQKYILKNPSYYEIII